jgi:hypothetical protein
MVVVVVDGVGELVDVGRGGGLGWRGGGERYSREQPSKNCVAMQRKFSPSQFYFVKLSDGIN